MSITVDHCDIKGLAIISPRVFEDERGFFFESYNQKDFRQATGFAGEFVQDNHSKSQKGVLRGLHFQESPFEQAKLVRVLEGAILDVAVDLRKDSLTFGKYFSLVLSEENRKQFWIPSGFAHGFLTLSNSAQVIYKATSFYSPENERCIIWNDPTLGITWPEHPEKTLSEKDASGVTFESFLNCLHD